MKVFNKILSILLMPLAVLLIISFTNFNHVSASTSQVNTKYVTKNAKWANTFKRQGYAYSLDYGNHDYILTNLSKAKYNKIVKDKVRFQVRHIGTYKNAISFNLVSKNGKYNTWASYSTDFYYTNSRSKSLKPIVNLECRIYMADKVHKNDFAKLYKMINHLKNGKDKSIAKSSYYQLKRYKKTNSAGDVPYLVMGNIR